MSVCAAGRASRSLTRSICFRRHRVVLSVRPAWMIHAACAHSRDDERRRRRQPTLTSSERVSITTSFASLHIPPHISHFRLGWIPAPPPILRHQHVQSARRTHRVHYRRGSGRATSPRARRAAHVGHFQQDSVTRRMVGTCECSYTSLTHSGWSSTSLQVVRSQGAVIPDPNLAHTTGSHCRRFAGTWERLLKDKSHLERLSGFHMAQVNCIAQGGKCRAEVAASYAC